MDVDDDKGVRRRRQNRDAQRRYRSAIRTHAEEIQAIREDIRTLKNLYFGSNVRIVDSIVQGASRSSSTSDNAIDDRPGSFDHLLYENDSTNKEGYSHLPDAILAPDVKYHYPRSHALPAAVDQKLGDWEPTTVAAKHGVAGSPFIGNDGEKVVSTADRDSIKHTDSPKALPMSSLQNGCMSPHELFPIHFGRRQHASISSMTSIDHGSHDSRVTALCGAVVHDRVEVVQAFLRYGVDVNKANPDGDMAVHICAMRNNAPILQLLIDHGAQLDVRNAQGETPLQLAAALGNVEIVETLLRCEADGVYQG